MSTFMMLAVTSGVSGRYSEVRPVTSSYTAAVRSSTLVAARYASTDGCVNRSPHPLSRGG